MKTVDLIDLFGSSKAIADFLGINRASISQWGDTVPLLRQYQLRERLPGIDYELGRIRRRTRKGGKR